nr:nitrous oxide-stimulated promoter family protein [Bacteroides sp.]
LLEYAHMRLSRCPFGEKKNTCRLCTIHCYKPEMKERMREVMRYAGPRMLLYHPAAALRHLWKEYLHQYFSKRFGLPCQEQHKQ